MMPLAQLLVALGRSRVSTIFSGRTRGPHDRFGRGAHAVTDIDSATELARESISTWPGSILENHALEHVHVADELGDEARVRELVDVAWRADLHDRGRDSSRRCARRASCASS